MIGQRLYQLRKDYEMTQQELADQLGLTKYTISSYETDKSDPSDEIKIQLAQIFNVSVDYLLGLVDKRISFIDLERAVLLPIDSMEFRKEVEQYIAFLYYRKYQPE